MTASGLKRSICTTGLWAPITAGTAPGLRLWAPTAEQVLVNLYRQGDRAFASGPWPWNGGNTAAGPLSARGPARDVLYLFGAGERSGAGDGGPLCPGRRGQRQPQHDRGPAPHRPVGLAVRPPPRHPPGPAGDLGGQRPRLLLGPGGRLRTATGGANTWPSPRRAPPCRGTASIPPA